IQAHFREAGADPTDVELETIAQTWSEHCKHKTLTGIVDYVERDAAGAEVHRERIDNLLKSTIARATHELMAKDDTANPFCLSVFVDNAGVIAFDETFGVAMKVETHNHPSALEPYGGAGTGIGGVIRDIMGTGLGARPILNTDVFCFGPPQFSRDDLPAGVLHPARVMRGVVAGVRDYGNRMGIPTGNGAIFFHERYLGNPLVYAGCVGIMPRTMIAKAAQDGDAIVVIGGRTGRDGIGGATFSSAELTSESETVSSGAVQIGNAIEEKRVLDVMLQARDRGLFNAVTDCGAGGLSSAVGEMGEQLGAEVQLDRVPLKYDGLTSREIWLSEAQERMVVAISPGDKLDAALALFAGEDVEATVIGTFVASGRLKLRHGDVLVADLDMRFLHDGLPRTVRKAEWQPAAATRSEVPAGNVADTLRKILAAPNVCSKEPVVRQYDHEVLAMSVVKPFVGPGQRGPSDGCVLQPVPGSPRGVVISNGLNPELGLIDPYHMATNAIDEAVRNALACGGSRRTLAILDNYSWGNCNKPDRFGGLVRASKACYELAVTWGLPFISGKDSLNNEYLTAAGEAIAIPPTLLISAIGVMRDVNAQTMTSELKAAGSRLFVLGVTRAELGGSHLLLASGLPTGTDVPQVRPAEAAATFDRLEALRDAGIVRACHDCAEGGLLTAVAEMAIGGGGELGASLDVRALRLADDEAPLRPAQRDTVRLFAESPSRFVLEIAAEHADQAASIAGDRLQPIGSVTDAATLTARGETGELMSASVEVLCAAWQGTLRPWFA
ncbi:MAG: phosphoribosylformylglycinamidine synthase subunit PurL, partial [Planctomycetota bacterium]